MFIDVYKSRKRLTKNIVRQMPRVYPILCQPFVVIGHVVNIVPGEMFTAIIQSGEEYYTLPLDYELAANKLSCIRKAKKGVVEFKFSSIGSSVCKDIWWRQYVEMREKALKKHIFLC